MAHDHVTRSRSAEAAAEVRALYAKWEAQTPARSCVGRAECCRFRATGRTPYLTAGEALVAALAWRAAGRTRLPEPVDGSCPFLDGAKCLIYSSRPFGCRTHFCGEAGGPAPRVQVRDLIHRLEDIDRRLGGDGGVNLPAAVRAALGSGRGR